LGPDQRKASFSVTASLGERWLNDLIGIGPKYSSENKLPALQHVLTKCGNLPLSQAAASIPRQNAQESLHVLIVGFDYDRNRATFFRSKSVAGPKWGCGEKAEVTCFNQRAG
jgi:hypothetical protein